MKGGDSHESCWVKFAVFQFVSTEDKSRTLSQKIARDKLV